MAYYPNNYGYFNPYNPPMQDSLNQFKNPYQMPQQPQIQPQMQPQMQQQNTAVNNQPSNDMIWVLGEVEATGYPVAPNTTVTLWDKDRNTVYLKSVNAQGVPSMRILDYTDRTAQNTKPNNTVLNDNNEFANVEQIKALQAEIDGLKQQIEELNDKKTATKKAKENE